MKHSDFQFLNPYLKEINFVINPKFDVSNNDIEMQNTFNVEITKSENENKANVALELETNINSENAPFKLRTVVASDFKWENLDDEMVNSMLNLNAPALLLGYMRPIVANVTNSSNFPAYNLPFINFKE